jgi:hypothetical protein
MSLLQVRSRRHYRSGAALLVRRDDIGDVLFDETFMPLLRGR